MDVGIEITSRCNLACAMCGHPVMKRAKQDMPWELFVKVINEIINDKHNLRQMHYYGEPVFARHYVKAIGYLASKGVKVKTSLSTNCMALTPDMTDRLIEAGFIDVHKKTEKVRLCIDSMDEKVYNKLRIGGNLNIAIKNAKYFIKKIKNNIDNLCIQRLVTRLNPNETDEIYKKEFGDIKILRQVCGRHHDKNRDFTIIPFEQIGDRRHECQRFFDGTVWIGQDGSVTKCCLDADFEQVIGNINEKTIRQLIMADEFQNQKKQFSVSDYSNLKVCHRCTGDECNGFEED